jgi:hypothetical protein
MKTSSTDTREGERWHGHDTPVERRSMDERLVLFRVSSLYRCDYICIPISYSIGKHSSHVMLFFVTQKVGLLVPIVFSAKSSIVFRLKCSTTKQNHSA